MASVEGYGAAKGKTGDNRKALSRKAGYEATMSSCESSTRSPHKGSDLDRKERKVGRHEGNDNVKGQDEG
jgi:hypothetical protein